VATASKAAAVMAMRIISVCRDASRWTPAWRRADNQPKTSASEVWCAR
jgi:hypothetical protein